MSSASIATRHTQTPYRVSASQTVRQLTPALYADLRRMAHNFMRRERAGHTLQPTSVVNEAFLKLERCRIDLADRPHFFRVVASAMRQILIDHAKARAREKRSQPWFYAMPTIAEFGSPFECADILNLTQRSGTRQKCSRAAELLELRYFAGLDPEELCAICNVSPSTMERQCRLGYAFVKRELQFRAASEALRGEQTVNARSRAWRNDAPCMLVPGI
jgi:RNA polymerase sigma factor (TIGR02999 family)